MPLNIVCFRYVVPGWPQDRLNALNEELLLRIQERGIAVPSSTLIHGSFCIRTCVTNHRTRKEDLDLLIDSAIKIGNEIAGS